MFTDLKQLFLCLLVSNSIAEPLITGLIVLKEGSVFELLFLELDSGFTVLSGGGGKISWIGYGC
jgi:hypothetical protein